MPLKGLRVIEMAGLAPSPMCGMILSDFGAQVTRVDKVKFSNCLVDCFSRGKLFCLINRWSTIRLTCCVQASEPFH